MVAIPELFRSCADARTGVRPRVGWQISGSDRCDRTVSGERAVYLRVKATLGPAKPPGGWVSTIALRSAGGLQRASDRCGAGGCDSLLSRLLSRHERIAIAGRAGQPEIRLRAIAAELPRPVDHPRVASQPATGWDLQPHAARQPAAGRRGRPKTGTRAADSVVRAIVEHGLNQRWSAQPIGRRLRRDQRERPQRHVTCETTHHASPSRPQTVRALRWRAGGGVAASPAGYPPAPTSAGRGCPPRY